MDDKKKLIQWALRALADRKEIVHIIHPCGWMTTTIHRSDVIGAYYVDLIPMSSLYFYASDVVSLEHNADNNVYVITLQ